MTLVAGLKRAGIVALGYIVAVVVAVIVAEGLMLAPTALPDQGRLGSIVASLRDLDSLFGIGLFYTFIFGLPGFLIVVTVASFQEWRKWSGFAVAGALNAVFALVLFSPFLGGPLSGILEMMLYCVPGGFAGGIAYWIVAVPKTTAPF